MNINQLRYFLRVAEVQNMTRAARGLNVSQPALGIQIRNLETEIGVSLIERHSRGIRLTPAGGLLQERLTGLLAALDSTVVEVRRGTTAAPLPVNVGLTPAIIALLGEGLFSLARDQTATCALKFVEALSFNLVGALLRDELHVALAFNVPEHPSLDRTALLDEPLFFITTPDRESAPVTFAEVLDSDLALLSRQDKIWSIVHETAAYLSLPVNIVFEVQSTSAVKKLVARGAATTVMPFGLVAEEVARGELTARPIANARLVRTMFLIRNRHASGRAAAARVPMRQIVDRYADALGSHVTRFEGCWPEGW